MRITDHARVRWTLSFATVAVVVTVTGCAGGAVEPPAVRTEPSPTSTSEVSASPPPSPTSAQPPAPSSPAASPTPRRPRVRQVVVLSLDGFGSQLFESLDSSAIPTLTLLRSEGASTLNARTEGEMTVTLPNHAGMMTGRPVDPAGGGHGVTVNADTGHRTVQGLAGEPVSSVFNTVHDAGGSTALLATEDKFALFERSWPDAIDDFNTAQDQDAQIMSTAIAEVTNLERTFTFVHLGQVDETGHRSGWLSAQQQDAAVGIDDLLNDLITALRTDRKVLNSTVLVVTADHGGVGRGHLDQSDPRNFRVPFIVWGPGVDHGADLYALNPHLADPGEAQPAYQETLGPVRNGFVANVVTQVLGLEPVEGSVFDTQPLTLCARCPER